MPVSVASAQTPDVPQHTAASRKPGASPDNSGKTKAKPNPGASVAAKPAVKAGNGSASPTQILQAVCQLRDARCIAMDDAHLGTVTSLPTPPPGPCGLLPSMTVSTPDADALTTELGSIPPFSAKSDSKAHEIRLYSSSSKVQEQQTTQVEKRIGVLLANAERSYSVDFVVPHAASLGKIEDLAKTVNTWAPELKVQPVGRDELRITAEGTADCAAVRQVLLDLAREAHQVSPETPVASALYLDVASLGSALGAVALPFAAEGTEPTTASGTGSEPKSPASGASGDNNSGTASGGSGSTGEGSSGGSTGAPSVLTTVVAVVPSPAGSTQAAVTPPAAPAAESPVGTGATLQQPAGTSGAGATVAAISSAIAAQATSAGAKPSQSGTPKAQPAFSVNGKDLYFPGGTPGDDAWITEKKRVLALLDLPQPQVLINAWVMQTSLGDPANAARMTNLVHHMVDSYNDVLQTTIDAGWSALHHDAQQENFFDPTFYRYITGRTVYQPPLTTTATATAADFVRQRVGELASANAAAGPEGICGAHQYCLGYETLLREPQPRVTDMLLVLLAARQPSAEAVKVIDDATQLGSLEEQIRSQQGTLPDSGKVKKPCTEVFCKAAQAEDDCERRDGVAFALQSSRSDQRMPLECFRDAMSLMFSRYEAGANVVLPAGFKDRSQLGSVRAAIADFLFNYKLSQQYPHEFSPYDLTSSAQTLDAALAPFVEAFNRDLRALQEFMSAALQSEIENQRLVKDQKDFLNGGILTVRTTSGAPADVNTSTQTYLDATRAPSLSQLVSGIAGAHPGGLGVLGNLPFNQAQVLEGALSAYQSSSLSIGRQLNLTVRPRSLTGASAAEIDIQLKADDSPNAPSFWTPGPGGGPGAASDVSRVAHYETTTHVRVDSLRLFEISSLTAVLSKGRDRFPLLPPLVELPYIGTLAGIPLRASKEYHNSSVVLSAIIVPTATDIAYSLRFASDRVSVANPQLTPVKATSMKDFGGISLREFHRGMLYCLASEDTASSPAVAGQASAPSGAPCNQLSPADAFPDPE